MARLVHSPRFRLVMALLLGMLPLVGLMAYAASVQRGIAVDAAKNEMATTAERVAAEQAYVVRGAQDLLRALAAEPVVTGSDSSACVAQLTDWERSHPASTSFWVAAPDGGLICGSEGVGEAARGAAGAWFAGALGAGEIAVGAYQRGRGGRPELPLAYPVRAADGTTVRVVATALDLDQMQRGLAQTRLGSGMRVQVLDRAGTVLAASPPDAGAVGHPAADPAIGAFAPVQGTGTTMARGPSGDRYLYGIAPLLADSGVTVRVGVPLEQAMARWDHLRRRMSMLLLGAALLTLTLALCAFEVLLLRRMRMVIGTARRLEGGDLTARINLQLGGELGALARAFNAMATALHDREQVLRRREAWYRLLLYSGRDAVFVYPVDADGQAGRFIEVNDEACARLGYTRDELLGMSTDDISDRALLGESAAFVARLRASRHLLFEGTHISKDGRRIPVEISVNLIDVDGQELVVSVARDVTERRRAAEQLAQSERRHRALIEHGNDLILVVGPDGVIRDVSPSVARLFGFAPEMVAGTPVADWVHRDDLVIASRALRAARERQTPPRTEVRVRHAHGGWRYLDIYVSNLIDEPSVRGLVVTGRDVTEQRRDRENLARQARDLRALSVTDELTGLCNRRGFMMIAEQHLALALRHHAGAALLFADMDGLKQINDTYGHQVGSDAIVAAAQILRDTFRESDVIARIGGDEFVVLATCSPASAVQTLIERLERGVDIYNASKENSYTLSLSIGSALYDPRNPVGLDDLLSEADRAMYEDKRRRQAARAA